MSDKEPCPNVKLTGVGRSFGYYECEREAGHEGKHSHKLKTTVVRW